MFYTASDQKKASAKSKLGHAKVNCSICRKHGHNAQNIMCPQFVSGRKSFIEQQEKELKLYRPGIGSSRLNRPNYSKFYQKRQQFMRHDDFGGPSSGRDKYGNRRKDQDGIGGGFGDNQAYNFSIYDATFTKVRELSLSYTLDNDTLRNSVGLQNVVLTVTGRNLININIVYYIDPGRG